MAVTRPRGAGKTKLITTASGSPVSLFTVPMNDGDVFRVRVETLCKELSDVGRANFERIGVFYRQGAQTYAQRNMWHTPRTIKSKNDFNLIYSLNATNVEILVQNATTTLTKWFGRLETDVV